MRSLLLVLSVASTIIGLANSATAQAQPGFEKALHNSNYPTASNEALCYAKTDTPSTFDLSRLCGLISAPTVNNGSASYRNFSTGGISSPAPVNTSSSSYGSFSAGSTSSGVCNVPSDTARDGSRCGGRAASERRGGR
ncbi:hypothetical protein FD723_18485 [Nostoc sp. C052]|uniref:hypothetical protein n=1 Tax=Nostoc sp. C052 TaxID=2576902 RepID=UPI0015C37E02|nr:hypothetical protein [Nostoc sp. C052]QLE42208.1 hypothetical protein FD723_18485 [Nostoc sp. C052]